MGYTGIEAIFFSSHRKGSKKKERTKFSPSPEDQGEVASSDWVSQEWELTQSFISVKETKQIKRHWFQKCCKCVCTGYWRDLVLLSREKMRSYCFQGILSTQQCSLSPSENLAAFFCSGCGTAPWPQQSKNTKTKNTINSQCMERVWSTHLLGKQDDAATLLPMSQMTFS